jgi:hypothetical protein
MVSSPFAFNPNHTEANWKYKKHKGLPLGEQAKHPHTSKSPPSFCVVLSKNMLIVFLGQHKCCVKTRNMAEQNNC